MFQLSEKNDLGIIEPTPRDYELGIGLVAKSLVHTDSKLPLRIINLSDETERLYRGTHVANLSFFYQVFTMDNPNTDRNQNIYRFQAI